MALLRLLCALCQTARHKKVHPTRQTELFYNSDRLSVTSAELDEWNECVELSVPVGSQGSPCASKRTILVVSQEIVAALEKCMITTDRPLQICTSPMLTEDFWPLGPHFFFDITICPTPYLMAHPDVLYNVRLAVHAEVTAFITSIVAGLSLSDEILVMSLALFERMLCHYQMTPSNVRPVLLTLLNLACKELTDPVSGHCR
eukprot:scaffold131904_cov36-Tisochrysis_lutea.AAC.1